MSSLKHASILAAALLSADAVAHGFVQGIAAEGKYYPGQSHYSTDPSPGWKADNGDNGFASSLTDQNIICHNNAVAGTQYVAINAGSSIELMWNTWPDSHKGPMLDYLAPCGDDCTTVDKTALEFTKIDEAGLITADPQHWASDDMLANNFTWVTTIPSNIAPGKYVLRHETIALHSAGSEGGAQAYPQCINIEVSGSGTNSLTSGGTLGTALYTPTDPGILINIYYPAPTSYEIPGPALMAGGTGGEGSNPGSGSGPGPSNSTASAVATSSTSASSFELATSSISVTATATSKAAVVTTTMTTAAASGGDHTPGATSTAAASATATIAGRKFVCYEEL